MLSRPKSLSEWGIFLSECHWGGVLRKLLVTTQLNAALVGLFGI
jgi:hypothetical protein